MDIHFSKYQGAGNDFIILDGFRNNPFQQHPDPVRAVSFLCDRRFGIGADGLMIMVPKDKYDFEMIYYNSDGNISSMCGNGGRCLVAFAKDRGIIKEQTYFLAADGPHYAWIKKDNDTAKEISLEMKDVTEIQQTPHGIFLDTGSPHLVKFVDQLDSMDAFSQGRQIRNAETYKPGGTNVNFVSVIDNTIHIRTYERGVEDETLACGTGITAAAIAAYHNGFRQPDNNYSVKARGGDLAVSFSVTKNQFSNVVLHGPASYVFQGQITI